MADSVDNTGNSPQHTQNKRYSSICRYKKRERQSDDWLAKLRTLPERLLIECNRRLLYGASAQSVAAWLLEQPDRGDPPEAPDSAKAQNSSHTGFARRRLGRSGLEQFRPHHQRQNPPRSSH